MNSFKDFLEILRLPPSILSALTLVTGLILLLPEEIVKKLYMYEFRNNYGFVISLVFLISLAMLIVLLIIWCIKQINRRIKDKKLKEKRIQYLQDLDLTKSELIKKFIKAKDHTLNLPTNSGNTIELSSYGLISPAGKTQLVTFGDIFTGDENTIYINYFLQPWVIKMIKEEKNLRDKFGI